MLSRAMLTNVEFYLGKPTPLEQCVTIPRKTKAATWYPLIPLSIILLSAIVGFCQGIFETHSLMFTFGFGFALAKLTVKLQVYRVNKTFRFYLFLIAIDVCISYGFSIYFR